MRTRYEAWLDKNSLSAIDPAIYIRDIAYESPRFMTVANDIPGRNGQHVTKRYAQSSSVTISFEIHERDVERRQLICQQVQTWAANGGKLTTNDRRGQQLNVICDVLPEISSALKWTQALKITFAAYEQPFWEDEWPDVVTLNANESKSLYVRGNGAQTRVEVSVTNTSGDVLDALTIEADASVFNLVGLTLANEETLVIDYDENGLLRMRVGEESKMVCRTAESSDDLLMKTGKFNTVSIVADGAVYAVFKVRGLYM